MGLFWTTGGESARLRRNVHLFGDVDASLVGEALSRLRDAGILRPAGGASSRLELAEGVSSLAQAEEKLVSSGGCLPGDYAA